MESKMKSNATKEQQDLLVELATADPVITKGRKFSCTGTHGKILRRWEVIVDRLNSVVGGAVKTRLEWQKTWKYIKSKTKRKVTTDLAQNLAVEGNCVLETPAKFIKVAEEAMESKMKSNATKEQQDLLVELATADPVITKGRKFSCTGAHDKILRRWEVIVDRLNSVVGGAVKTRLEWQKTWKYIKSKTKRKVTTDLAQNLAVEGNWVLETPGKFIKVAEEVHKPGSSLLHPPYLAPEELCENNVCQVRNGAECSKCGSSFCLEHFIQHDHEAEKPEQYESSESCQYLFVNTNDSDDPKMIQTNKQELLTVTFKKENQVFDEEPIGRSSRPSIQKNSEDETQDLHIYQLEDGRLFVAVESEDPNERLVEESTLVEVSSLLGEQGENSTSSQEYKCLYTGCTESFVTFYESTVHMKCHTTDIKPYACTIEGCDKIFATNFGRKTHVRTHTGEKPYLCEECSKPFKTSGDLRKHSRVHSGEKPFQCPVSNCGRSFRTSNTRKVHVRSHTGERPYVCDYPNCGKAFASSTNFKNHSRIHSGEKPFVCEVSGCNKRFTEYSSLHKHAMVHQESRPYDCSLCDQSFKSESARTLHKRVKHNVIISDDGTEIVVCVD